DWRECRPYGMRRAGFGNPRKRRCSQGWLPHCGTVGRAAEPSLRRINFSAGGILCSVAAKAAGASDHRGPTRGKRLMQLSRFVRKLGLLLVLGLPGFGVGCGPSSTPLSPEDADKVKASHRGIHKVLKEEQKAVAKKIEEQRQKQGAVRRGAHR